MAMSIGSVGSSYGMNYIQPMNYALKNESEVSDEFVQRGVQGLLTNVTPVRYPNAQAIPTASDNKEDPMQMAAASVKKSQEANRMYNDVAEKFQGMTVGYSQDQAAVAYGMQGYALDLFA